MNNEEIKGNKDPLKDIEKHKQFQDSLIRGHNFQGNKIWHLGSEALKPLADARVPSEIGMAHKSHDWQSEPTKIKHIIIHVVL